jgi:DNA polymerase-3 subunit alpha
MYSVLDGFARIDDMVAYAKEQEMPAIALTDHGTMFGAVEFFNKAIQKEVKPIIGLETYMAPRRMTDKDPQLDKNAFHLLLLAENMTGYKNLLKIASDSQLEGFYYKPRIDHEYLAANNEGLIATTACFGGEVPQALYLRQDERAIQLLDYYFEVFGRDRFFLEYQRHNMEDLEYVNQKLLALSKRYNAHNIATNDAHYVRKEDWYGQDVLLAIQTGSRLSEPDRLRMNDNSYYLRSPQEMKILFKDIPGAIDNTLWIAERCEVDLSPKGYHLPNFEVPAGYDDQSYLRHLCEKGLIWRYGEDGAKRKEVRERLEHELTTIHDMGFDAYFLIVWDLCEYARKNNIWFNTRGSGAGSIVAYSLGITLIEPMGLELIFERFLNPGRISMPDIDLDFQDDKRAEIMEYCAHKYGSDKVAAIITFGTLGAKAAIRDVGRVMGMELTIVDQVAKTIPTMKAPPLAKAKEEIPELNELYRNSPDIRELIDTAEKVEGMVRNVGTHAAGVVVTDVPLVEYAPLHRPTGDVDGVPIKTVCQYEMKIVDDQGLLKVDFLGLSTLTVMQRCCDMIEKRHGVRYEIETIPIDDPETFAFLGQGNTAGVFQLEGGGMTRTLVQMQPKTLRNVIALISLYRPGPMQFIPDYIACMKGEKEPSYRHPKMKKRFAETYGIPVYQEQIMFAAMDLAGYTPPESDDLRKAIAKKMKNKVEKHRTQFIQGCVNNGIDREVATAIFGDWEDFASYGFNKSHAADYALVAVTTGYLKCHYTVEYMTALLSVFQHNTDKVAFYVADCRDQGIDVLPPTINQSGWDFTIEETPDGKSVIRYGMGAIKNVGHGPSEIIVHAREKDGPFKDITDFARRVDLKAVGKRALESLIRVGAMDEFGPRRSLMEGMDQIIAISASHMDAARNGQMSFFGFSDAFEETIELPPALEMDQREILEWERELLGLFISAHPMDAYTHSLRSIVSHYSGTLSKARDGNNVVVAGIVSRIRPYVTKKNDPMGFVTLEDNQGPIDCVVFPRAWKQFRDLFQQDAVVIVSGKVDNKRDDTPKILVDNVKDAPVLRSDGFGDLDGYGEPAASFSRIAEPVADFMVMEQQFRTETQFSVAEDSTAPFDLEDSPPDMPDDWGFETIKVEPALVSVAVEENSSITTPQNRQEHPQTKSQALEEKTSSVILADTLEKQTAVSAVVTEVEQTPALRNNPIIAAQEDTPPQAEALQPEQKPVTLPTQVGGRKTGKCFPGHRPYDELPHVGKKGKDERPPQKVFIHLSETGIPERDRRRLRRILGELRSYPGNDLFAFYVIEKGTKYLIDFPNDTTGWCDELKERLCTRVGLENIEVQQIPD